MGTDGFDAHHVAVSRFRKEDIMEKTLDSPVGNEVQDRRRFEDTPHAGPGGDFGAASGDPPTQRGVRRARVVGAALLGLALVVLGGMLYVTRTDLVAARTQMAALEREVSATEASAASAARTASDQAAAREDRIAELMGAVTATEDELATVVASLAAARAEAADLEGEVTDIEAVVAAVGDDVVVIDALTALQLAWWTWGVPSEDIHDIEQQGIDTEGIDAAVRGLGLAEDWEAWASTNFFVAARAMGDYVRTVDDPILTAAWDAWVACATMEACLEAAWEVDAAMTATVTRTVASLRATTGVARSGGM
jgi:hypothetical protein